MKRGCDLLIVKIAACRSNWVYAEVLTKEPEVLESESCNACNSAAVAVCSEAEVAVTCACAEATSVALASALSCFAWAACNACCCSCNCFCNSAICLRSSFTVSDSSLLLELLPPEGVAPPATFDASLAAPVLATALVEFSSPASLTAALLADVATG